jgi:hypothetical protein
MAALCAAVAVETGIPEGRVRKVIQAAKHHQHAPGLSAPLARASTGAPDAPADPLRFYPLGANGRLRPPAAAEPA